jgi:hypothetical protein
MNEIQQGANRASTPATTAAMTDPPKKILLSISFPDLYSVMEANKIRLKGLSLSTLTIPRLLVPSLVRFPDVMLSRC